jgi:hypothetical protein
MVKECLLNPSLQWSNPRPTAERLKRFGALTHFERMEVRTLRCEGASSNELDEGDEWAPTLAEHTVSTELGIPYGRRLLGGRSHRSSPSWGKPSTWRRVTGLEASEREGMRDAESRPEWMPPVWKAVYAERRTYRLGRGRWKRAGVRYHLKRFQAGQHMTQYLASCLLYFKNLPFENDIILFPCL